MDEAIDVVLAAIRAVEQRDVDGLLELYHDDIEFHDAPSLPYGGVIRGKSAIKSHTYSPTGWAATWGPLQPTSAERLMSPEAVASHRTGDRTQVVISYRHRALSPDGERLSGQVLAWYEVRDGKLSRAQMFHYDTAAVVGFLRRAHVARETKDADRLREPDRG